MKQQLNDWLSKTKLQTALWVIGRKMKKLSQENDGFQQLLKEKNLVLQLQTHDKSVAWHYAIDQMNIISKQGIHHNPSSIVSFIDAPYAMNLILKPKTQVFMAGLQSKEVIASGDLAHLMWFASIGKYLR